ncbi:hypothetical protein C2G38_2255707 [Gigaspora rosea]|uniref:F-box domain-containing protein n=1 Tax=Gigaspora rosea TaxID=44941 RepID=A0A397TVY5_9GLOM|nr:hypothetical protein C2G38_2255707 [Gigaspora rosea]
MHFAEAKSLTFLSLSDTKLTEVVMSALKDLENLVELYLDLILITDASKHCLLRHLHELTHLSLSKARFNNASLSTIRKSTFANRKVKYLDVGYTLVNDKGIRELRDIPSLQPVCLNGNIKEVCENE